MTRPVAPRQSALRLIRLEDRVTPVSFGTPYGYPTTANTGSAAVGNLNGDSFPDIAALSAGGVTVFLNDGTGKMNSGTLMGLGTGAERVVRIADMNGDGKQDILTAHELGQVVTVLRGNGNGTFQAPITRVIGTTAQDVFPGDFNGDGKLDIAVANGLAAIVCLNDGSATLFGEPVSYNPASTGGPDGIGINVGDFNEDGKLDIAMVGYVTDSLYILFGKGDGTFTVPGTTLFQVLAARPLDVDVADLNHDGNLDLVIPYNGNGFVGVHLGNGNGTFGALNTFATGFSDAFRLSIGDLDLDSHPDLVVCQQNTPGSTKQSVLLGDGTGLFGVAIPVASATNPIDSQLGDFNQDGLLDLLSTAQTNPGAIVITPNTTQTVASFSVTAPPGATAGSTFTVTVTAKDQGGATFVGYTGTVHFTSTDSQAGLPLNYQFTAGDNGVKTFDVVLKTAGSKTVTVVDTLATSATGFATVAVTPAAATKLLVAGFQSTVTAGDAKTVTVTAKDDFGNIATGYTGIVAITSTDPQAGLPTNYGFTGGDAGVKTFSVTLKTVGSKSITATDLAAPALTGTQSGITVTHAAAAKLELTGLPGGVTAGDAKSVTVTARDAFNNVATGFVGTVHFSSTDSQAGLPVDYPFAAGDNGTKMFAVALKTAGDQSITVASVPTGLTPSSQTAIVSAAAPSQLTIGGPGTVLPAGQMSLFIVNFLDAFGNLTNSTAQVTITTTDPAATAPSGSAFNGQFGGAVTYRTVGVQTLTASATGLASVTANTSVTPAAASKVLVAGFSTPILANTPGTVTITALDPFGNRATGYLGTVRLTSSDPSVVFPENYTFQVSDQGQKTLAVTLKSAGPQSITATDTANGALTGTQSGIVVTPGVGTLLVWSGLPGATTAGAAVGYTITVRDAFGNVATGFTGTVQFASSAAQATLPAAYPFEAADGGVKTFTATLRTAVATTITVSAPGFAPVSATTTVSPAAATRVGVSGFPTSIEVGQAGQVTVTAFDAFGNVATGYTGSVRITTTASIATVPPPAALSNGTGTFAVTLSSPGTQSITATDTVNLSITGTQTGITVVSPAPPPPTTNPTRVGFREFAVGTDNGGNGTVQLFNPDRSLRFALTPFPGFTGGVRTVAADFTRDGIADLVVGTGPGRATRVVVFDGVTQAQLFTVAPFEASFTGGVYVAAGDLTGDGIADLVITPDEGGGPRARVFDGNGFTQLADFFGIEDTAFRGGARPAIGDITGDGIGELIVAAGFSGGPRVGVFNGAKLAAEGRLPDQSAARWNSWKPFGDFLAFEPALRNGTYVAAGDLDGDGFAELIAGGGPGGGPRVTAFSGAALRDSQQTPILNFFAGNVDNRGGVRVAVKNLDGDARADLVVGAGAGGGSRVTAYLGANLAASNPPPEHFAFDAVLGFTGGIFVG